MKEGMCDESRVPQQLSKLDTGWTEPMRGEIHIPGCALVLALSSTCSCSMVSMADYTSWLWGLGTR
jgi:hypothetical protein